MVYPPMNVIIIFFTHKCKYKFVSYGGTLMFTLESCDIIPNLMGLMHYYGGIIFCLACKTDIIT